MFWKLVERQRWAIFGHFIEPPSLIQREVIYESTL